jgi:predicted amidohydrolase
MTNTNGICPHCNTTLTFDGSCGIVDYDGEWEAQAERYYCPNGHTIFVVDTDREEENTGVICVPERNMGQNERNS